MIIPPHTWKTLENIQTQQSIVLFGYVLLKRKEILDIIAFISLFALTKNRHKKSPLPTRSQIQVLTLFLSNRTIKYIATDDPRSLIIRFKGMNLRPSLAISRTYISVAFKTTNEVLAAIPA